MFSIHLEVIPHANQRYNTCGDWWWEGNFTDSRLELRISKLSSWEKELLIGVHEIVEAFLCRKWGISQAEVDSFDLQFEKDREAGLHDKDEEPGDCPAAPYHNAHVWATNLERTLAFILGVPWSEYEKEVENLVWK